MAEIGETVLVHYVASLGDGREIENTRLAGEPLKVTLGKGVLLPAIEGALCDMLPGDRRIVELGPAQAYGVYDNDLVQRFPSGLVPNAQSFPVGGRITLATRAGTLSALVVSVDKSSIVLDCNHEFAGQAVTCDLEMLSVIHESAIHRELHPAGCACGCDKLKEQLSPSQ